jgi:hypothetical protein
VVDELVEVAASCDGGASPADVDFVCRALPAEAIT